MNAFCLITAEHHYCPAYERLILKRPIVPKTIVNASNAFFSGLGNRAFSGSQSPMAEQETTKVWRTTGQNFSFRIPTPQAPANQPATVLFLAELDKRSKSVKMS